MNYDKETGQAGEVADVVCVSVIHEDGVRSLLHVFYSIDAALRAAREYMEDLGLGSDTSEWELRRKEVRDYFGECRHGTSDVRLGTKIFVFEGCELIRFSEEGGND